MISGKVYLPDGSFADVKRAFGNVAAAATDALLTGGDGAAGVAGKKLRIIAVYALCAGTGTTITINRKPAGAGVAISAALANGANGGEVLPVNEHGWCETAVGEGVSVTTGAGSATGVGILYIAV